MSKISRRQFTKRSGAGLVAVAAVPLHGQRTGDTPAAGVAASVPRSNLKFTVNGVERRLEVEDRWTLVEVLRDHLELTGTKIGCDRGECGACTVLIDGKPMYSCSQLAVWMDGKNIQTIEGLAQNGRDGQMKLDPLQEAFIAHDGPQCGFCTSGQLMSAKAVLNANPHPTRDEVKAGMTGNICRCSNYNHYVESVMAAVGGSTTTGGGNAQ
jgi:aerobic-type carbon monoxide dehydrogenase small subunit (CoxS/CutS family)